MKPRIKLLSAPGLPPYGFHPTKGPPSVVHALLIEGQQSLLLVEVGLGTLDYIAPFRRLGFPYLREPRPTHPRPLRHQLASAGYRPDDVTDIVVSHLHVRHTGGLYDFPHARIHGLADALRPGCPESSRLIPSPNRWCAPDEPAHHAYGFRAFSLPFEDLELSLVELPGRYRGHAGVLVPYEGGHVFHIGYSLKTLDALTGPISNTDLLRSLVASKRPFSELETLTKLRKLYRMPNAHLLFVSSAGHPAQRCDPNHSISPLPILSADSDG